MLRFTQRFLVLFLVSSCFLLWNTEPLKAVELQTTAESAILMDAQTGKVLFEKNANKELPPASVTKLMTLLVATEAMESGRAMLTDTVTASENASSLGGSQIYLEPGEQFTLEELLISIAVGSANDGCVAVAEHLYGTHEKFVEVMNEKATNLGLKNTHFANAYGLPAQGHYTSAYDLALIGREALKHPLITKLTSIKEYDLRMGEFKLWNTNKLLWWYEGSDGFKTGWTQEAKYCLASTVEREGLRLISVVMGVPEVRGHFHESIKLFNYGFANYAFKEFAPVGSKQGETKVQKGIQPVVELIAAQSIGACLPKGKDGNCWTKIQMETDVKAPVKEGQKLGEILLYCGQEEQARIDLLAKENIDKATLMTMIKRTIEKTYLMSPF